MKEEAWMLSSKSFLLSRSKIFAYLDELEAASDGASTLYLPEGTYSSSEDLIRKILGMPSIPEDLRSSIIGSKTGSVIFWGKSRKCLVLPPFPLKETCFLQGYDAGPLHSILKRDFTIGLVLVRLGAYAIGVARGDKLVSSKVGTGLVHARHRQGGSSSHRFERHRDKQIETFLTRVCGHAREQLEPYARMMDYMVYGGAWTTILALQKQCAFLSRLKTVSLPPLLTITDPRQAVLESSVEQVWSSMIIEYVCT